MRWSINPADLASRVTDDAPVAAVSSAAFQAVGSQWLASPPTFNGIPVPLSTVAAFMRDLLTSDPFGSGDSVPYMDMRYGTASRGGVVAITQRQLAFIVANVLMGNTIPVQDGLTTALARCSSRNPNPTGYLFSLLAFLAVLSQELAPGSHGTMLVAASPGAVTNAWRDKLGQMLVPLNFSATQALANASDSAMDDFMAGGVPMQALTDIAGNDVGGGAALCDVANSQDESLVQFYSEVLAFAFFVTRGAMLPVPWALLGARRYLRDLSGESSSGPPYFSSCGRIPTSNWLNEEIMKATMVLPINGVNGRLAASSFVAVASVCSACQLGGCPMISAINNNCDAQRRHLDADIQRWYQAYEPTMYHPAVQSVFQGLVRRIGTGPWGAGLWYGDSQQYFLAKWLATSLLSSNPTLDYYLYDHFCENPGNQCFVLGAAGCTSCLATSHISAPSPTRCGSASIWDMKAMFQNQSAQALYAALNSVGGPPQQVFDLLQGQVQPSGQVGVEALLF